MPLAEKLSVPLPFERFTAPSAVPSVTSAATAGLALDLVGQYSYRRLPSLLARSFELDAGRTTPIESPTAAHRTVTTSSRSLAATTDRMKSHFS
eukprot:CAMPEP_0197194968 /NCGR_PEP_ID=MMETSP1423-20130617/30236_1 /TAXON_ID=476441 /ORGANISM="Pseudo-nitzschia heimii, Strain UNC1101" /LENGTH=93 /DNA_ID=CAMNT_0042648491 /DNA_START=228 /DNA_END=506 /DNA_ORIENTATION=-